MARAGRGLDFHLNYAYTEATFEDRIVDLPTPVSPGNETVRPGRSFALVPRYRVNAGVSYHPWPGNRYETFVTFAPNSHEPGAPVERFPTPAPPISMLAGVRYVF